jgi:hypothetical protein
MMSGKKGMPQISVLVALIFMVALLLVLVGFLYSTGQLGESAVDKETCKLSVQLFAKAKVPGFDVASSDSIKCHTETREIDTSTQEKAKKDLANAMFDCFDNWGDGELELFDTESRNKNNYCIVCSKLEFTKDEKVTGLTEYLTETTISGKGKSYYQFIKGTGVSERDYGSISDENLVINDVVDASKDYAVIFNYGKTIGWWDKAQKDAIASSIGLILGGTSNGWTVSEYIVDGGTSTGYGITKIPYLETDWQAGILMIPLEDDTISQLDCSEIPIR